MKLIKIILLLFLVILLNTELILAFENNNVRKSPIEKKIEALAEKCWNLRSNNPTQALSYAYQAYRLIQSSGEDEYESTVLNYIGVVYGNIGKLDSAYFYSQSAYNVAKSKKDKTQMAYSLTNLGDYYSRNALYPKALENLLQAYDFFETLKNKRGMAYTMNYIGEIYLIMKDFEKAKSYLLTAAEIRKSSKDLRGYAKSLLIISELNKEQNHLKDAYNNLHKALKISKMIDFKQGVSESYSRLSDIHFKKGRVDSALYYRKKALEIDLKIENKYDEIRNYNSLGQIYLHTKNLAEAKIYLTRAETEASKSGHFAELLEAYRLMTKLYTMENNFKDAYLYLKKSEDLNEKLFGQETRSKIADIQTAFAIEKKEKENLLLKKDIEFEKETRNYLLLISALVLVGVILIVSKYRLQTKTNKLLVELAESKDKFFSIIAHDLKNPFGAILSYAELLRSDYAKLTDDERIEIISGIQSAAEQVQNLLNDLLTWARTQKGEIALNKSEMDLCEIIENIVDSYKLASEKKRITVDFECEKDLLIIGDELIIKTIVGNLINNAIKFSHPDNKIIVTAKKHDSIVEISVTDFGIGMSPEITKNLFNVSSKFTTKGTANEVGTGLGLKICHDFAKIHNGKLSVESKTNEGSKFSFTFKAE